MSTLATLYPTTEYLTRALGLQGVNGFVIASCFLLIATLRADDRDAATQPQGGQTMRIRRVEVRIVNHDETDSRKRGIGTDSYRGTTSVVPLSSLFLSLRADFSPRGIRFFDFFSNLFGGAVKEAIFRSKPLVANC